MNARALGMRDSKAQSISYESSPVQMPFDIMTEGPNRVLYPGQLRFFWTIWDLNFYTRSLVSASHNG